MQKDGEITIELWGGPSCGEFVVVPEGTKEVRYPYGESVHKVAREKWDSAMDAGALPFSMYFVDPDNAGLFRHKFMERESA